MKLTDSQGAEAAMDQDERADGSIYSSGLHSGHGDREHRVARSAKAFRCRSSQPQLAQARYQTVRELCTFPVIHNHRGNFSLL